jgi:hypothetical protein
MLRGSPIKTLALMTALAIQGCATGPKDEPILPADEFPLGSLTFDLPGFRTLEELKAWQIPLDRSHTFDVFEKDDAKVAVLVVTWGSGDYARTVYVYQFDRLRTQWVARALWTTEAYNIRVTFDQRSGTIRVRSVGGAPIFSANIGALKARRTRDW